MAENSEGKASPGKPFKPPKAEIWNSMIDAGNAYRNGQLSAGIPDRTKPRHTDIIKVKNDSGGNRSKGEILSLTDKAIADLSDEHIWLLGSGVSECNFFGVLKEPIADGAVGDCQVSGCCLAQVEVVNIAHSRANVVAGQFLLRSSSDGPIDILYKPSGTGELECVIRFGGGPEMRLGRTGFGGLLTTASGTVTLYEETFGGFVLGTETVQAWAFPTPVTSFTNVAIWKVGCRLVAFKVC